MESNYIFIAGRLALSNGEHVQGGHLHTWRLNDGRAVVTSNQQRYALVITRKLVDDPKDWEQLLVCLNNGDFDTLGIAHYGGHDMLGHFRESLNDRMKTAERKNTYNAKVAELDARYKNVDTLLKLKIKSHDAHYSYSDDINVYRAGRAAEDALNKEIAQHGESAKEYAKAYFSIQY